MVLFLVKIGVHSV